MCNLSLSEATLASMKRQSTCDENRSVPEAASASGGGENGRPIGTKILEPFSATTSTSRYFDIKSCNVHIFVLRPLLKLA
jgi:hypothetical protein